MNTVKNVAGVTIAGTAVIDPSAAIGIGSVIHDFVVIGPGVTIGRGVTVHTGASIGRTPQMPGRDTHTYRASETNIGDHSIIGAGATIYNGVHLEPEVLVGDGARIREQCFIGYKSIVGSNCTFQQRVKMGSNSRVVDLSHITAGVFIGNNVFISTGVLTMNDNSFNHDGALSAPRFEDGCMVGGNATILPGVVIGENARVAAGATVTKNVAPGVTVWGVPAKPRIRPSKQEPSQKTIDCHPSYMYTGNYPDADITVSHDIELNAGRDWAEELLRYEKERDGCV